MKDKILQLIKWGQDKIRSPNIPKAAMRYIIWYALLLAFCCTIYLIAWCADWYISRIPNLPELRNFLHEIASAAWVAVVGFICRALIDENSNGIPDEFEDKENKKGNDEK